MLANEVECSCCVEKKCTAFMKMLSDGCVVQELGTYAHSTNDDHSLAIQHLNNDMKWKVSLKISARGRVN